MAYQRLPILRVVQIGNDEFDRIVIEDEQSQVWTGQAFGQSGVLYADHKHAATDVQTILKKNFEGVNPQRYVVPLFVEVYSDEPVPVAQVAMYLSTASRLLLNTTDHGNGPGDSLVLSWIDWNRIKKLKETPHV